MTPHARDSIDGRMRLTHFRRHDGHTHRHTARHNNRQPAAGGISIQEPSEQLRSRRKRAAAYVHQERGEHAPFIVYSTAQHGRIFPRPATMISCLLPARPPARPRIVPHPPTTTTPTSTCPSQPRRHTPPAHIHERRRDSRPGPGATTPLHLHDHEQVCTRTRTHIHTHAL